jgi:hypothetical protein
MKRWVKKNRWKRFLRTGSIDDDVSSSTAEINSTVEKLQASPRGMLAFSMTNERVSLSFFSKPRFARKRGKWWNTCKLMSSPSIERDRSSLRALNKGIM